MPPLTITKVIVTPTQHLVVEFLPPASLPPGSGLALEIAHEDIVSSIEFAQAKSIQVETAVFNIGKVDLQIPMGIEYDLRVQLLDENGDVITSGEIYTITPTLAYNDLLTIQQAVYDALTEDTITDILGRTVQVLDDGYFQPEDISDGESVSAQAPFIAISRPAIVGSETIGNKGNAWEYRLEIRICDVEAVAAANDVTHLYAVAKHIIHTLKVSPHMDLRSAGIGKNTIKYSQGKTGDITEGDNLNSVTVTLEATRYTLG